MLTPKKDLTLADLVDFSNDRSTALYYHLRKTYCMSVPLFEKLAENNDPIGQYWLGNCYEEGTGIEKDYEKAAFWYKKAAEQGDSRAADKIYELKRRGLI